MWALPSNEGPYNLFFILKCVIEIQMKNFIVTFIRFYDGSYWSILRFMLYVLSVEFPILKVRSKIYISCFCSPCNTVQSDASRLWSIVLAGNVFAVT